MFFLQKMIIFFYETIYAPYRIVPNEVYQIYLNKTMKKQNSFCKKVIENP